MPIISGAYLGIARSAVDAAMIAAAGSQDPITQRQIGLMRHRVQVAQWALDGALEVIAEVPEPSEERMMAALTAKREVALAAVEVCDLAMEVAGGSAFRKGSVIERAYRDVRPRRSIRSRPSRRCVGPVSSPSGYPPTSDRVVGTPGSHRPGVTGPRRATIRPADQPGARPPDGGFSSVVSMPLRVRTQDTTEFEFHISPTRASSRPHTAVGTEGSWSMIRTRRSGRVETRTGLSTAASMSGMTPSRQHRTS